MSEILERLRNYNPPDRTIDEQRQISVDISDAADRIEHLEAERDALRELLIATNPPCKGKSCGSTDGVSHSPECFAEHEAIVAKALKQP